MKRVLLMALVVPFVGPGCSSGDNTPPNTPVVELRADTNRNGTLDWNDPTEIANKNTWDATHGAIFLANIDDDQSSCPTKNSDGTLLSDVDLPKCNDAADTVVNGPNDALDLAPLGVRGWPTAPAGTSAALSADAASAPFVHFFIMRNGALTLLDWQNGDVIHDTELQAGNVTLAIEATDVVRDPGVWNGYVTVHLAMSIPGDAGAQTLGDDVKLRVAPVVTRHQLAQEEQVFVTSFNTDPGSIAMRSTLYSDMAGTGEGDGGIVGTPPSNVYEIPGDEQDGPASNPANFPYSDQWAQDFFEVGYMSMPAPNNKQQVITVYIRSANIFNTDPNNLLRTAGKVVFTKFRGPDAAGLQQYDPKSDPTMDSLNSYGNLETIPPYSLNGTNYPLGRVFRGNVSTMHPDLSFIKMMEAQLVQPPVYIDTSWLLVGHVDETTSFVKAPSQRGWALLLNDPALAKQMLQDQVTAGNGNVTMFTGLNWLDNNNNPTPAQISISGVLADTSVMSESDIAAAKVSAELTVIEQATGITESDIVRIPYLHEPVQGQALAYQVGTVNGLYYAGDTFAAPDPHGPVINNVDIFKDQMQKALATIGLKVVWVEDWDLYHRLSGEVHCGTNSRRGLLDGEQWWTSGY